MLGGPGAEPGPPACPNQEMRDGQMDDQDLPGESPVTEVERVEKLTYDPGCSCCELLGHKWTPQIVAVLLAGPHRFSAIHTAIPTLSDKVLSRRLAELEQAGIVSRHHYLEIPPRVEYALTAAGLALEPVIAEMDRWSRELG